VHIFYANVVSSLYLSPYFSVVIPTKETKSIKNVVCSANYGDRRRAVVHKQSIKPQ